MEMTPLLAKAKQKFRFSRRAKIGYVIMIFSAAFTGLTNTFAKPLIDVEGFETPEISPVTLVAIIYLINALFFSPFARKTTPLKTIGKRNSLFLVVIGVSEVAALMTYFFGLKEANAVNAAILAEGEMIFSLLIAITVLRERLQRKELGPFAMIVVGMIAIPVSMDLYHNGFAFSDLVLGDLIIIVSGILYAIDINLCKYISKRIDPRRTLQLTSIASGLFALGIVFLFNIPVDIAISQIPNIITLSIIGTGLAAFLFIISLALIGAVRTLLIYSTSGAFGVIFSSTFLGEPITFANIVSVILTMIGIYFLRNRLAEDDSEKDVQIKWSFLKESKGVPEVISVKTSRPKHLSHNMMTQNLKKQANKTKFAQVGGHQLILYNVNKEYHNKTVSKLSVYAPLKIIDSSSSKLKWESQKSIPQKNIIEFRNGLSSERGC